MRDLGDKSFLMLRNHGILTAGATIPDAFLLMYLFEAGARSRSGRSRRTAS